MQVTGAERSGSLQRPVPAGGVQGAAERGAWCVSSAAARVCTARGQQFGGRQRPTCVAVANPTSHSAAVLGSKVGALGTPGRAPPWQESALLGAEWKPSCY